MVAGRLDDRGGAAGGCRVNAALASDLLMLLRIKAAHGGDDDDGYVISDRDMSALYDIELWLRRGPPSRLPTPNLDRLKRIAFEQQMAATGGHLAKTCAALGVDVSNVWRWRQRWAEEDRKRFSAHG